MTSIIHRLLATMFVLLLVAIAADRVVAEPEVEQLPPQEGAFGHSGPFSTGPSAVPVRHPATATRTFPYGGSIAYEHQRTCWPHGYCHYGRNTFKARAQCSHWGYPENFCERPFGSIMRMYCTNQAANGLADQMALYRYDFYDTNDERAGTLNSRGIIQAAKVAELAWVLQDRFCIVSVEPTGDEELDEARRRNVVEKLAELGAPIPPEQVVTAKAAPPGLDGVEAFEIYLNQLQQTRVLGGTISPSDDSNTDSVPTVGVGVGVSQ